MQDTFLEPLSYKYPKIPKIFVPNAHNFLLYGTHRPKATSQGKKRILFVARLENWKRPQIFVKLAEEMQNSNFEFLMVGGKSRMHSSQSYENLLTRISDIPNIKFLGSLNFLDSLRLFNESTIYIHTSQSEGFPNTFIHAWYYRTLIITFDWDPDNLFLDRKLGISAHGKFSEMLKILTKIETGGVPLAILNTSQAYVNANHSMQVIGQRYLKIYNRIIG